jgi:hypothetical protein
MHWPRPGDAQENTQDLIQGHRSQVFGPKVRDVRAIGLWGCGVPTARLAVNRRTWREP